MKRAVLAIAALTIVMALVACNPGGSGYQAPFTLSAVIVDIPTAISSTSSASTSWIEARQTSSGDATVKGIYDPIRTVYNPLAERMLAFADESLTWIDTNILSSQTAMERLDANGEASATNSADTFAVHVTKTTSSGVDTYTVQVWQRASTSVDYAKKFHAVVNHTPASGAISGSVYGKGTPTQTGSPDVQFVISFETDSTLGLVVEARGINLSGMVTDATKPNKPDRIWIKANNQGSVFNMAANVRYIEVDLEPVERDTDGTTKFSNLYMKAVTGQDYTAGTDYEANYVYRAVVETDTANSTSYGKVDLALVQETYPTDSTTTVSAGTTAMFTNDAIGKDFETALTGWVLGNYLTDINNALNSAQVNSTKADLTASSTTAEVIAALEEVQSKLTSPSGTAKTILDNFAFVQGLTNPGYFDGTATSDANFFAGTENYTKPTWASTLADNSFAFEIEVFPTALMPPTSGTDTFAESVAMPKANATPTNPNP